MGNCLSNKEVEGSVHAQKRVTKIAENNTHKRQNYTFGFKTDFHSHYELSKTVLGRGSYGMVILSRDLRTGESVAVKVIDKSKLTDEVERRDLMLEVDVMNRIGIGSLNCIWLYDTFEDAQRVYMVMEVADGGTLLSRIQQHVTYTEENVAAVARCVLRTLAQCHAKNVIYRDIKPDNFVYKSSDQDSKLKAIDFGLAVYHPPGSPNLKDITGTPYFMAPEVVHKDYSFECDVWSAGVLLYLLLTGHRPFNGDRSLTGLDQTFSVLKQIMREPVPFGAPWKKVSAPARDLVERMLQKDPKKRIKLQDALQHPWLVEESDMDPEEVDNRLDTMVVSRLQRYATYGVFKQQAMVAILRKREARSKDPNSVPTRFTKANDDLNNYIENNPNIKKLCDLFGRFDLSGSGMINHEEAKVGLYEAGYDLNEEEADHIWSIIDVAQNGEVDINEFLAAMLDWDELEKTLNQDGNGFNDLLFEVFSEFDKDCTGRLNLEEVALVLHQSHSSAAVRAVFTQVDSDGDGKIDFEEFKCILTDNQKDSLKIYDQRLRKAFKSRESSLDISTRSETVQTADRQEHALTSTRGIPQAEFAEHLRRTATNEPSNRANMTVAVLNGVVPSKSAKRLGNVSPKPTHGHI